MRAIDLYQINQAATKADWKIEISRLDGKIETPATGLAAPPRRRKKKEND